MIGEYLDERGSRTLGHVPSVDSIRRGRVSDKYAVFSPTSSRFGLQRTRRRRRAQGCVLCRWFRICLDYQARNAVPTGSEFPPACDDVHHFNRELLAWLARSPQVSTVGKSHDSVVTTVPIGNERCQLHGDTSRDGVVEYLRLALDGTAAYFVVPSTRNIVHRVTVGSPSDRIQGFYLYTGQIYAEAQAIATANGTEFGLRDVCFKLLDAIALLHSRGHQRLRVLPNLGGAGRWRMVVVRVEDITYEQDFPHWGFDSEVFTYTSAAGHRAGALDIRPDTAPEAIAREILAGATDLGVGMDWAYAGWYSELLAESHRLGELPVYYAEYDFPYASSWEIGPGSKVAFPPPPRANARHGFPGEFSETPVELASGDDLVPFLSPPAPKGVIHGDIAKRSGFMVLHALFRAEHGAFIGLYARTRGAVYRREPGLGWVPVPKDSAALNHSARVAVNYRFIKSLEILAARDERPDWDLAERMSIFGEQF